MTVVDSRGTSIKGLIHKSIIFVTVSASRTCNRIGPNVKLCKSSALARADRGAHARPFAPTLTAFVSVFGQVTFSQEGMLMDKSFATFVLGGDAQSQHAREQEAARWIGVSAAVYQHEWPARLHPVMADRVIAANFRRELAKALGQSPKIYFADFWRNEALIETMMANVSASLVMLSLMPRVPVEFARRDIEAANEPKRTPGRPRLRPLKASPDSSAQAA